MKSILLVTLLAALGPISQSAALSAWTQLTSTNINQQPRAKKTQPEEVKTLGTVEIAADPAGAEEIRPRRYLGSVLFQFPEDDGQGYRVDVVISKPNRTPTIDSKRIDVWLLAKRGKVVSLKDRPRDGPLIEVNSAGTSANAMYFFKREVPREDVVAVVVSIDAKLYTFKVPPPDKANDKGKKEGAKVDKKPPETAIAPGLIIDFNKAVVVASYDSRAKKTAQRIMELLTKHDFDWALGGGWSRWPQEPVWVAHKDLERALVVLARAAKEEKLKITVDEYVPVFNYPSDKENSIGKRLQEIVSEHAGRYWYIPRGYRGKRVTVYVHSGGWARLVRNAILNAVKKESLEVEFE